MQKKMPLERLLERSNDIRMFSLEEVFSSHINTRMKALYISPRNGRSYERNPPLREKIVTINSCKNSH